MNMSNKFSFFFLFLLSFSFLNGQEICDNGIDDDGDMLVDLNDDDCDCFNEVLSSLIPNPSFEERSCCPQTEGELHCADAWIQASAATTDYVHTCGVLGNPFLGYEAPLPFPDGNGGIGYRDGKPGQPNFKEYAGACLTESMKVGNKYTLDFYVGFHDVQPGHDYIKFGFYATPNCGNLPFGNGNTNIGCPLNTPQNWDLLGEIELTGYDEWIKVVFEFEALQAYEAIVLGPACEINPNVQYNPYFYMDNLILVESSEYVFPFAEISGDICEDELMIAVNNILPEDTFQWYHNGVALQGETGPTLILDSNDPTVEGEYECLIESEGGCFQSEKYIIEDIFIEDSRFSSICEGEAYDFYGTSYTQAGVYTHIENALEGCDSLIILNLTVNNNSTSQLNEEICEGDVFQVGSEIFDKTGNYNITLQNYYQCDSVVFLNLTVIDNSEATIKEEICEGEVYTIGSTLLNETGYYELHIPNKAGCDSTVYLDLLVHENTGYSFDASICEGGIYTYENQMFSEEGIYPISLVNKAGCDSTVFLNLSVKKNSVENISASICDNETYEFNGEVYDEEGLYFAVKTNSLGCDSTIFLNLTVNPNETVFLEEEICEGEVVEIDGINYTQTGNYEIQASTLNGCDSLIFLDLFVHKFTDSLRIGSDESIELGESISLIPEVYDVSLNSFIWTNEKDEIISEEKDLVDYTPFNSEQIVLTATNEAGCEQKDTVFLRVDRRIDVIFPNIFSPNDDRVNDFFRPSTNKAITAINQFMIFDRWGGLVYQSSHQGSLESFQGWNGRFNGQKASIGVYSFKCELQVVDGGKEEIVGTVTLVR